MSALFFSFRWLSDNVFVWRINYFLPKSLNTESFFFDDLPILFDSTNNTLCYGWWPPSKLILLPENLSVSPCVHVLREKVKIISQWSFLAIRWPLGILLFQIAIIVVCEGVNLYIFASKVFQNSYSKPQSSKWLLYCQKGPTPLVISHVSLRQVSQKVLLR